VLVENFAIRLRRLRQARGLTQEELGKRINVTKVSVSGYESGNRGPDTDTLQKIADVFDVSVDYLLCRTEESGTSQHVSSVSKEEREFLKWIEENLEDVFFYDFHESADEQKKQFMETMKALWEVEKKRGNIKPKE